MKKALRILLAIFFFILAFAVTPLPGPPLGAMSFTLSLILFSPDVVFINRIFDKIRLKKPHWGFKIDSMRKKVLQNFE
jgi:hypothetical protein